MAWAIELIKLYMVTIRVNPMCYIKGLLYLFTYNNKPKINELQSLIIQHREVNKTRQFLYILFYHQQ